MTNASPRKRLAMLWFVAAALAAIATAIGFIKGTGPNWSVAAGGLFCLVMGISAARSRPSPPPPTALLAVLMLLGGLPVIDDRFAPEVFLKELVLDLSRGK